MRAISLAIQTHSRKREQGVSRAGRVVRCSQSFSVLLNIRTKHGQSGIAVAIVTVHGLPIISKSPIEEAETQENLINTDDPEGI